jgi:ribosomal protein S18 acetylase RimI-like enzyme
VDVIRNPLVDEFIKVSEFIWDIFEDSISGLYDSLGREVFFDYIHPEKLKERYEETQRFSQILVLREGEIVGWMEVRDSFHISMLFVKKKIQRQGIGRKLVTLAEENAILNGNRFITLNSSPNSIGAYISMGFAQQSDLCMINGVKFFEMKKDI